MSPTTRGPDYVAPKPLGIQTTDARLSERLVHGCDRPGVPRSSGCR